MVIVVAAEFSVCYTKHTLKGYTLDQIVLVQDMILPNKHIADWKLIPQRKQTQIHSDNNCKNTGILYH